MPKGKAKKSHPGMYETSPEPQQSNMAPQAVAHRRGGTHRVRDKDRTDSVYDNYNYKELLDTAKDRGIYRKDMKKVEMAWALKNNDDERKRFEHVAMLERQRREQEKKDAKRKADDERQAIIKAKRERTLWKEKRRDCGEVVSEDSLDEDEFEAEHDRLIGLDEYAYERIGQALSDESWDSTSTESTTRSADQPIIDDCALRIFEWPYQQMPSLNPPALSPNLASDSGLVESTPIQIPYAPLKVITTNTRQKLILPGQKYPPRVKPEYVPVLSPRTRLAARNGVLEGVLHKATIERATDWAVRTQIQGWNARIYFQLPARNETKDLANVYSKWNKENRKLLRVSRHNDVFPQERARRHAQRNRNKGREIAEVYEACQYRPSAVCYIPSYLDYSPNCQESAKSVEKHRSLENLFFIRFPTCDVPHYYFWAHEGYWADPTIPNTAWNTVEVQQEQCILTDVEDLTSEQDDDLTHNPHNVALEQPHRICRTPARSWVSVKKRDITRQNYSPSSDSLELTTILSEIEFQLYRRGLAETLAQYRAKWLANGKQHFWHTFSHPLPVLYPSGQIPQAPPINPQCDTNVAAKIAMIEISANDEKLLLSPLRGDEAWTRDDTAFWDVVEVDDPNTYDGFQKQSISVHSSDEQDALYRCVSATFPKDDRAIFPWLEQVSPAYVPPTAMEPLLTPAARVRRGRKSLQHTCREVVLECPFCCFNWEMMTSEVCCITIILDCWKLIHPR